MESNSMPMRIHVSEKTKSLLGSKFRLKERGETKIKGKGLMKTFWLEGKDEEVPMKRVMSAGQVRDNRRGYIPISSEDLLKCDRRASAPKIFKMKDTNHPVCVRGYRKPLVNIMGQTIFLYIVITIIAS